jgi:phosphatidylserine/phosphatidylglycerophosphate/cardiolipin synthase-like enzyme
VFGLCRASAETPSLRMLLRSVSFTSVLAARARIRMLVAAAVVLGTTWALLGTTWVLPPSQARQTSTRPYLDYIERTLMIDTPRTESRIWWTSFENILPPGWLLQTLNCWGQVQCSQPPPGGAAILQRMVQLIATARRSVDIAELYQLSLTDGGPEGAFLQAIIDGLRDGHRNHPDQEPVVRILIGKFPVGPYSADAFARQLQGAVGPWLKVQSASMRTGLTSWNHAKVLDVDGRAAIVGGMNYWTSDYLDTAHPVNDVSMEVVGPAAAVVSRYDDVLWSWTCDHRRSPDVDVTLLNLPDCIKVIGTVPAVVGGKVPIMVVGHLGNGISVPGEPYGQESAPFQRPPLHGNKCTSVQRDVSETNDSRAYEYRNPGEVAVRALIQSAQRSIFISQQDLLSCLPKPAIATEAKFDERLFAILADKIAADVPITIVLSAGGGGAAGYSNGWTIKDTAETLLQAVEIDAHLPAAQARRKLCQDVGLAAIRNGPGSTWADGKPFSNHAKLVAVDDQAFYIGSQNLYPGRLQELGLIVEDRAASAELFSAYLRPLWEWSKGDALINPATKKCDV